MLLSPDDMEEAAESMYLGANADPSRRVSTFDLALRLLGPMAVRVVPRRAMYALGAVIRVGTAWRIVLRADTPTRSVQHVVGHELAHWYFRAALRWWPCTEVTN